MNDEIPFIYYHVIDSAGGDAEWDHYDAAMAYARELTDLGRGVAVYKCQLIAIMHPSKVDAALGKKED